MKVLVLFVNIRRYNERVLKFLTYEEARFSCCMECEYNFVRRKNEEDKMGKKLKKERGNKLSGRKVAVNKKHKDRLFCMLFGDSENKKNILSLYNALNGTQYTDADDLTITTIDDVIYVGMKNDVSFLLDSFMSLWEQQSTFIAYIREYQQKGYNINEAVDKSVNKCIEEDILAEFLQKHRAEVFRVCLKEFNKEVYEEGIREESREEGRMEGRVRERIENIRTMLKNGRSKEYILDLDMKYTEKEIEQAETEEVSKF